MEWIWRSNMKLDGLKPCPFCGCTEIEYYEAQDYSCPMICCSQCPAGVESCNHTLEQLKEAWNKRCLKEE
jgi:hypothetical protein